MSFDTGPARAVPPEEALQTVRDFLAERAAAGVMYAQALTRVDLADGVLVATWDPSAVGQAKSDALLGMRMAPDLVRLVGTPLAFDNEQGRQLRQHINTVVVVTPRRTDSMSARELYRRATGGSAESPPIPPGGDATSRFVASCFLSYSHADTGLAEGLATELRRLNYFVWIDAGRLRVGDSLTESISSAIGQVDFLIALVSRSSVESNWCRKELALALTGEIAQQGVTVLPCMIGGVTPPPALVDKLYLEVDPGDPKAAAAELDRNMQLHLNPSDPIPPRRRSGKPTPKEEPAPAPARTGPDSLCPVRMLGVDLNGVTAPRNDGTRGSALYKVPIQLDTSPDSEWCALFVNHFDHPSTYTAMHRPGIASIIGDRIFLDGTTMAEIEQYHLSTLRQAVAATNEEWLQLRRQQAEARSRARSARSRQAATDAEIAKRMDFS